MDYNQILELAKQQIPISVFSAAHAASLLTGVEVGILIALQRPDVAKTMLKTMEETGRKDLLNSDISEELKVLGVK